MNKLHASIVPGKPYQAEKEDGFENTGEPVNQGVTPSIRVEVYQDDEYLGKKVFSQERIIIGKSIESDLVLSHKDIAVNHACISFIENKPVILDQANAGLKINGCFIQIAIIETAEQIGIGPFVLKITDLNKITDQQWVPRTPLTDTSEVKECLVFEQDPPDQSDQSDLSETHDNIVHITDKLNDTYNSIEHLETDLLCDFKTILSEETEAFEEPADQPAAEVSEFCGEPEEVQPEPLEAPLELEEVLYEPEEIPPETEEAQPEFEESPSELKKSQPETDEVQPDPEEITPEPEKESAVWQFLGAETEEEEDEEYEDLPADFLLKNKIDDETQIKSTVDLNKGKYLEILKLKGERLIDIRHLDENEKFNIRDNRDKRFCLAEFKSKKEILFYFNDLISGIIENEKSSKTVETRNLMIDACCVSKRKRIYSADVPAAGMVEISDGLYTYRLRIVNKSQIPAQAAVKESNKRSFRHLGASFTFHIVFLLFFRPVPIL